MLQVGRLLAGDVHVALMSTRQPDWPLVSNLREKFPSKIHCAYGLHPWWAHDVGEGGGYVGGGSNVWVCGCVCYICVGSNVCVYVCVCCLHRWWEHNVCMCVCVCVTSVVGAMCVCVCVCVTSVVGA